MYEGGKIPTVSGRIRKTDEYFTSGRWAGPAVPRHNSNEKLIKEKDRARLPDQSQNHEKNYSSINTCNSCMPYELWTCILQALRNPRHG